MSNPALALAIRAALLGLTVATNTAMAPNALAAESSSTQPARKSYAILAGPLGKALYRFAADSGVLLSFDQR